MKVHVYGLTNHIAGLLNELFRHVITSAFQVNKSNTDSVPDPTFFARGWLRQTSHYLAPLVMAYGLCTIPSLIKATQEGTPVQLQMYMDSRKLF